MPFRHRTIRHSHYMPTRWPVAVGVLALLAGLWLTQPAAAQTEDSAADMATTANAPMNDEAQRIYQRHGDAIYQIQVTDRAADKKNSLGKISIGSGFQFTADGLIATNYHVVADAIQRPGENRVEFIHDKFGKGTLTILTADVLQDLAILKLDTPNPAFVELGKSRLPKGVRMFSLGNPHDIGFTIVEGTYNGVSQESLIDKIHFSGAINPGMSGGPVLGHDGRVVGINVATAGNQIGFLVPVESLRALMVKYLQHKDDTAFLKDPAADIQQQLLDGQARSVDRLMQSPWDKAAIGRLKVPERIDRAFKCWGGQESKEKDPYTHYRSNCSTEDSLFLDEGFTTGTFSYRYDVLSAKPELNAVRFYNIYEQLYMLPMDSSFYYNARERDVTNFDCNTAFVDMAGERWKASTCVRRYKKYPGIYDVHLYMAMLGHARDGMMISFAAQGVSQDNGQRLLRRFLDALETATPAEVAAGGTP